MKFDRHRRLLIRVRVRENHVRKEDLIYPIFVVEKDNVKVRLKSRRLPNKKLDDEINEA